MDRMKRLVMVLVLGLMICFTTACSAGAKVNTKLQLSEDLSGVRELRIVVDQELFASHFKGSIEDLTALIGENCPTELEWSFDGESGEWIYTFTLSFQNEEEYRRKVGSLRGVGSSLELKNYDTPWQQGLYVSEDFDSLALLDWLRDLLLLRDLVEAVDEEYLYELGDTAVVIGDQVFATKGQVYLDCTVTTPVQSIVLSTQITDLDRLRKTTAFWLSAEGLSDERQKQIENYFLDCLKGGMCLFVEKPEGAVVYRVSGSDLDKSAALQFDQALFGERNVYLEMQELEEFASPFTFSRQLQESISLDRFLVKDRDILVEQSLRVGEEVTLLTSSLPEEGDRAEGKEVKLSASWQKSLPVRALDITATPPSWRKPASLSFHIRLDEKLDQDTAEAVLENCRGQLPKWEELAAAGEVSLVDQDGITILLQGDLKDINTLQTVLLGDSSARWSYQLSGSRFLPLRQETSSYRADFSQWITNPTPDFRTEFRFSKDRETHQGQNLQVSAQYQGKCFQFGMFLAEAICLALVIALFLWMWKKGIISRIFEGCLEERREKQESRKKGE